MKKLNKGLLFIVFIVSPFLILGQTKESLKKQKIEIEKEILYTKELLNKTKLNKTKSLNYLKVLDRKIKIQEQLLITLNIEISLLKKEINKTEYRIKKNKELILKEKDRLQDLKNEYAKMIYAIFKKKGNKNDIMFILSADDFNQAYKRVLYLKQYTEFRKQQALKINKSQKELIKRKEKLAQTKDRINEEKVVKTQLLEKQKQELKNIAETKKEKNQVIKTLIISENKFKKKLQEKQKKSLNLEKKIRIIIEEEIAKIKEKNKKNVNNLTPESLVLSEEFAINKGKLPWPLLKGVIVSSYGTQKHPVFSAIETFNNGIDIATDRNAEVRAVFDGIVSRIFFIKGEGKAVLVSHGEYFSVYSGLKNIYVKEGEKLFAKEKIGVVITNQEEKTTELHFEIWKGYEKNDPSNWLYKAY